MKKKLANIAKRYLRLETLETRNSDSLDFSDQSVWSIEAALREAYLQGAKDGFNATERPTRENTLGIAAAQGGVS